MGDDGLNGEDGEDGEDGEHGTNGASCPVGGGVETEAEGVPGSAPLSSMVSLTFCDAAGTGATNIADYVKALVGHYGSRTMPPGYEFPLAPATTDSVRAIRGLVPDTVIKWLDPFGWDNMAGATTLPRFGANADYIAYFGDGWQHGATPSFQGSSTAGWAWVNHEYVSNGRPRATAAPTGQFLTLARFLAYWGTIGGSPTANAWSDADLNIYVDEVKKQVGGSWFRIMQDPSTGEWAVDRSQQARRYDATDATLVKVTGMDVSPDHTDTGVALPEDVVVGIMADCSGTQTPWGTIITAEENVAFAYGDLETGWSSNRFAAGMGFDPGANVSFNLTPSTTNDFVSPDANASHPKDAYSFLVEMDPGVAPDEYYGKTTPGAGHRKLGYMGRANWENAAFAVGADWKLIPGQPIVIYAGNDRTSGHIYKFVTAQPYQIGMTKAQIRAMLDSGKLYVSHFAGLDNTQGRRLVGGATPTEAAPGTGQWLELSTTSTAIAPNAAALGVATKTVGQALTDVSWNGIGGFPTDNDVRKALFTASLKIGAMELNRPEDIEYNPLDISGTPRLYVTFTNHRANTALDQNGVLLAAAAASTNRNDAVGGIFAIEEAAAATPATSMTFEYFQVWAGNAAGGTFDAGSPDNLAIDADGGVWFGTDGYFGSSSRRSADALYYLDLDPAHRTTSVPTYGLAFRVVAAPSDAEATGPAFTPDMRTLFFNVQHPGEDRLSNWPPR